MSLVTAIGQSVIVVHGTTLTYGPGSLASPPLSTRTASQSAHLVRRSMTPLGGLPHRAPRRSTRSSAAQPSRRLSIDACHRGHTYTIGPGTGTTTTVVVSGPTAAISPAARSRLLVTFSYPFGPNHHHHARRISVNSSNCGGHGRHHDGQRVRVGGSTTFRAKGPFYALK